jgi:peptidoglycan/LPS O-acetylase OafA/YrhL
MVDSLAAVDLPPRAAVAERPGRGRIEDIELLRGIAILFVLVEHTSFNLVTWGSPLLETIRTYFGLWTGVDLFFAISGFVIARSLLPVLETCTDLLHFWNATIVFWVRRGWRTLPSAWLWLALLLLASIFFNESNAFRSVSSNVAMTVAALFNVANIHVQENAFRGEIGAAFPYWSLSLEEQFYLILPILALLARRHLPLLLAALVLVQLFLPRQEMLNIVNLRSDALMLGVLIAIWAGHPSYRQCEPTGLAHSRIARAAMLVMPLWLIASMGSHTLNIVPFRFGVVAVLSALLVFVASYDRDYLMHKGPLKRLLVWFGSRSYALYLTHIPAFFATREIWFRIEPPGTDFNTGAFAGRYAVTALLLLFCFAELNYRFVETPLRRRGAGIAARLALRVA